MASPAATANASALLKLARDCRDRGDTAGQAAALDRLLAADPRNIPALIQRADCFAAAGDARSASSFYLMAIRSAPPVRRFARDRRGARAREAGLRPLSRSNTRSTCSATWRPRASILRGRARALRSRSTSSSGRKRIFVQQPKYYYFPGLPQIQFYERRAFPVVRRHRGGDGGHPRRARGDPARAGRLCSLRPGARKPPEEGRDGDAQQPAWSAHYLWKNGEVVAENAARFPKTMHALRNAPLSYVPNRSPSILFSLLRPGAHIPPHNGLINTRLICHLPVIVPGKCRFRVGNETRDWVEGKGWAFDDTIEHEAWNGSDRTRVILLFDVWRPGTHRRGTQARRVAVRDHRCAQWKEA